MFPGRLFLCLKTEDLWKVYIIILHSLHNLNIFQEEIKNKERERKNDSKSTNEK